MGVITQTVWVRLSTLQQGPSKWPHLASHPGLLQSQAFPGKFGPKRSRRVFWACHFRHSDGLSKWTRSSPFRSSCHLYGGFQTQPVPRKERLVAFPHAFLAAEHQSQPCDHSLWMPRTNKKPQNYITPAKLFITFNAFLRRQFTWG